MRPIAYSDIAALRSLDRKSPDSLPAVARQFEAMFVDMMLQAAHSATAVLAEGNPLQSNETDLHEEMLNHQLAMDMSQHGGIGLAPLLVRQLSNLVPGAKAERVPAIDSGATHDNTPRQALAPTTVHARYEKRSDRLRPMPTVSVAPLPTLTPTATPTPLPVAPQITPAATAKPAMAAGARSAGFASPVAFVRAVLPAIERATRGTGIAPLAVLAQAALETGWGKAVIGDGQGRSSFNLFGVKADARWAGAATSVSTLEFKDGLPALQRAAFRMYDDVEHGVQDFVQKLQGSARYAEALAWAHQPTRYAVEIGRAGYATDPAYTKKLQHVLTGSTLASAVQQVQQERAAANNSNRAR